MAVMAMKQGGKDTKDGAAGGDDGNGGGGPVGGSGKRSRDTGDNKKPQAKTGKTTGRQHKVAQFRPPKYFQPAAASGNFSMDSIVCYDVADFIKGIDKFPEKSNGVHDYR